MQTVFSLMRAIACGIKVDLRAALDPREAAVGRLCGSRGAHTRYERVGRVQQQHGRIEHVQIGQVVDRVLAGLLRRVGGQTVHQVARAVIARQFVIRLQTIEFAQTLRGIARAGAAAERQIGRLAARNHCRHF